MISKNHILENQKLLKNLYSFYRLFIASGYKKGNVKVPHIKKLAEKLMDIYEDKFDRLCVAMPPRHSKSSMVTLAFPLWLIFQDPNLNILVVNAEASLSEKFGIRLREDIKKYGYLFDVYLSDVKHSSTHLMFENSKGELQKGSIRLVGANGSITGQDADYLIIDDPYKGFEDIIPSRLEKKIDWFKTMILQRLEPESKLIILHTRWHTNDIQGYLKENFSDEYKFIEFSAIKPDGTSLWPERYTIENLKQKAREMGERLFSSIYQQKPLDDSGDFFDLTKIHWERPDMKLIQKVRGWDIASSDPGKNDFTDGVPMELCDNDKSVLITDFVHGQFGGQTRNQIVETTHSDGVEAIQLIETGVAAAGKLLFQEWEEQLTGYFVEQALPIKSKTDRATPLQNAILDGDVYVDIQDEKLRGLFIKQLKSFPLGEHDDIVDASSHAYNYLNENFIGAGLLEVIDVV